MKTAPIIVAIAAFLCAAVPAEAYWIWTPKTGKFINPKAAVRTTPKEQFESAKGLYDAKSYDEALREFKKLLKAYPKSQEAAEGQYYLGLIEEEKGNLFHAYQAYQKVIDKYPFSQRVQEVIEREFKIAEAFMAGKNSADILGNPLENPSIEIFTKVIENSTYGPLAAKAQYKLGLVLKGLSHYYEAEEAFNKVLTSYPDSEWVPAAKFQIASCRAAVSQGPAYDQGSSEEAKKRFEAFISEHPDAVLGREAEKKLDQLKQKEAQSTFDTGLFYEKQKAWDAARVYYNSVLSEYSDTPWGAKAMERLQIIDRKKNK